MKQYRPLTPMRRLADRIVGELAPYCERIEVAGSIRRGLPNVGDIDLVALPLPGMRQSLIDRFLANTRKISAGQRNISAALANGVEVQLFLAHGEQPGDLFSNPLQPSNWASLLICRTGSREHNIKLVHAAARKGLRWNPQEGLRTASGNYLDTPEEEDFFATLGIDFIAPAHRQ